MIELEVRNQTTLFRLSHGPAHALDLDLLDRLDTRLGEVADDSKAVVITGTGSMFSAGVDLRRVLAEDRHYTEALIGALDRCLRRMTSFPRPLIAAVNGHAIAGGLVIACGCDYRLLAAGGSRLGLTELAVGVPFPRMAFEVVRQALGSRTARRLILGADLIDESEAKEIGVVDEVVASDLLIARACEIGDRWASISPGAFSITKRQFSAELDARMLHHSDVDAEETVSAWVADETRTAIERFVSNTIGASRS